MNVTRRHAPSNAAARLRGMRNRAMNPKQRLPTRALALLLLAGCVVGPDHLPPAAALPERFEAGASNAGAAAAVAAAPTADDAPALVRESADLANWWREFDDPLLASLIERAAAANLDLAAATASLREARARAGQSRAELLPALDATGSAVRQRLSENGAFPMPDPETGLYRAGFDSSWELDLFGGHRRALEAALADADATLEQRRAVQVSLAAEVAAAYVELRGSQRLVAVARGNVASAQASLELLRERLRAGLSTELDVARAETLLSGARAPLPGFEGDVRVAVHRLGVLLAMPPAALAPELEAVAPIPAAPRRLLVGVPAELLARRPDLRRAERELAAATARVGVAHAERYPKISLTGSFGLESASLGDFTDAASRAFSIGPSLRWPLFAGGRILAGVEIADARAEQARLRWESTLLVALEEVENAIVRCLREWEHRRVLESGVAAHRRSVELAGELFRRGLSDYLDVLDAQRELHAAELDLAGTEAATTLDVITLYKALGGGWNAAS